jgi:hypothetical protein
MNPERDLLLLFLCLRHWRIHWRIEWVQRCLITVLNPQIALVDRQETSSAITFDRELPLDTSIFTCWRLAAFRLRSPSVWATPVEPIFIQDSLCWARQELRKRERTIRGLVKTPWARGGRLGLCCPAVNKPGNRPHISVFFQLWSSKSTCPAIRKQESHVSSVRDVWNLAEEFHASCVELVEEAPLYSSRC